MLDSEIKRQFIISNVSMHNSRMKLSIPLADFIDSGSVYPNPRRFFDKIPIYCNAQRLKDELTRRIMERAGDTAEAALQKAIRGE